MTRIDIINKLISLNGFKKYLEIGVRNPADCFNKIEVEHKISVDSGYESPNFKYDYRVTSDEFFNQLDKGALKIPFDHKWDIVFIDGLHTGQQVYVDVQNSLNHLTSDGFIVLHDCNPPTIHHAREDYQDFNTPAQGAWNGTVWKAVQRLRQECIDQNGREFNIFTVNTDWGVGVVRRGNWGVKLPPTFNPFYEYNVFRTRRREVLNLIAPEDFNKWEDFLKTRNSEYA